MATKRFCDVAACGKEVTDYPTRGFIKLGDTDLKIEVNLLVEAEFDVCKSCFWKAVQGLKAQ